MISRRPDHPWDIFRKYLSRCGHSHHLALLTKEKVNYLEDYRLGRTTCTEELASLLAELTDTSINLWLNLQKNYDDWELKGNGNE